MCGIVEALDLTGNRDFPAERLRAMARAIAHRGPDDEYFLGLDRAGPDERSSATESARALGAPLTMVTLDRAKLAWAFPGLMLACEGPVYDTSSGALMRLAEAVHDQGYKVALTGEGADEALAGYVWHKTQAGREWLARHGGTPLLRLIRAGVLGSLGGGSGHRPPLMATRGIRVAQQDLFDFVGQARMTLYSRELLRQVATRMLPPRIANRPKTMFRAKFSFCCLGHHRPAWVDQLLSPESLRAAGCFDPRAVARERAAQVRWPRLTPRRFIFDVALTSVVATQLWHHLFFGGGLCDLPAWSAPAPPLASALPEQPSEDLAVAE